MDWSWLAITLATLGRVALSAVGIYLGVVVFTRIAGLRSFSKLSAFDFAVTIAIGSVIASTVVLESVPPTKGLVALVMLYLLQMGVAVLRERSQAVQKLVNNDPVLLMVGPQLLKENLKKVQMTEDDVRSKLREANVLDLQQVRAVIMEATGDVSVLHGAPDDPDLDAWLLEGVTDGQRALRDNG